MDQRTPELETPRNGLPIISQETRDRLLEEMGIGGGNISQPDSSAHPTDQLIREAIDLQTGITAQAMAKKTNRAEDYTLSSLDDIVDSRPELLSVLKDAVQNGLGTKESYFMQRYAWGIGLVIKSFHVQSDFRLIPDLNKLTDEDLLKIGDVVSTAINSVGGLSTSSSSDPFTRALNRPRIPAHQQFLREIVDGPPQINSMFDADYKVGAGAMYRAMEVIWTRLYPGQTPPSEPPSVPPTFDQTGPQFPPG